MLPFHFLRFWNYCLVLVKSVTIDVHVYKMDWFARIVKNNNDDEYGHDDDDDENFNIDTDSSDDSEYENDD